MTVRRISFQPIPVDDHDRALAFCRDVLGFAVETDVPYEDDWRRVVLTIPGSDSRIHLARRYRRALRGRRPLAAVEDSEGNPVFVDSWKAGGGSHGRPAQ